MKFSKSKSSNSKAQLEILYEDDNICVINKPSGLLSVPYSGSKNRTALSMVEEIMRKNGSYNNKHRPFAVHRLDRETSGIMMFALSEKAQKIIMDTWHQMVTERLYRAIAENPKNKNLLLPKSGLIDDELAFNAHNIGFVPKDNLKENTENRKFKTVTARTNYKIIEQGKSHTLFELSLDTGKKNQIRAHLAGKGYPLAGDENYRARTDYFHRLCLHACTLTFIHPFTNEKMHFEIPEPKEWQEYVQKGDLNPKTPIWIKEIERKFESYEQERFHSKKTNSTQNKGFLSKKQKAHMNYIEVGLQER